MLYLNCVELFLGDCGSCKNVTEDGGIIESPNFPDEYSSNLSCLFTINAPPEKKINLTFTELSVKECCDFITVSLYNLF
jgi:cubilin